jgi:hypothetical protein
MMQRRRRRRMRVADASKGDPVSFMPKSRVDWSNKTMQTSKSGQSKPQRLLWARREPMHRILQEVLLVGTRFVG